MELKNLDKLKEEINYLEESEELLQAIVSCIGIYELSNILYEKHWDKNMGSKFQRHLDFDDSE